MENVSTMRDVVGYTLQLERLSSLVMTFFGLAALLMATLGIYGVVLYFVRQRTVELGTRMALGAINRDLVALVLGDGLKLSVAGVAIGFGRARRRRLAARSVPRGHELRMAAVCVFHGGGRPRRRAAAAVPAWRTTLIPPMVAIREQPPSVWRWARQGMERAARDVRQAVVGGDDGGLEVSAADMLTAFVDAARGADSYPGALRAVLASVCDELKVESAASDRAAGRPYGLPLSRRRGRARCGCAGRGG